MDVRKFKTEAHAKWIMCGEHTVVRGGKALAFPLRYFVCTLHANLSSECIFDNSKNRNYIQALIERAAEFCGVSLKIMPHIRVNSDIPSRVGFGSSAAICVSMARFFEALGVTDDALGLGRYLEHYFHGKSSGLDIAVILHNKPIVFENNQVIGHLTIKHFPIIMLTYSGKQSSTLHCMHVLRQAVGEGTRTAERLDQQMNDASELCEIGLQERDIDSLKKGINLGLETFRSWNLCDDTIEKHIEMLFANGALAAKPIGAGLGGYIMSLWSSMPDKQFVNYLTFKNSKLYYPLFITERDYE